MKNSSLGTLALFGALVFGLCSCEKDEDLAIDKGVVVVNELMASNSSTATDNYDEYDDWVELYNNSDAGVDLSGFYLSDDSGDLKKWQFPSGTSIAAHGFLIVWCDDDAEQTGLHTPFKLSATGEEVVFSDPNGNLLDQVTFGAQSGEQSYARSPNGTGNFGWTLPTYYAQN